MKAIAARQLKSRLRSSSSISNSRKFIAGFLAMASTVAFPQFASAHMDFQLEIMNNSPNTVVVYSITVEFLNHNPGDFTDDTYNGYRSNINARYPTGELAHDGSVTLGPGECISTRTCDSGKAPNNGPIFYEIETTFGQKTCQHEGGRTWTVNTSNRPPSSESSSTSPYVSGGRISAKTYDPAAIPEKYYCRDILWINQDGTASLYQKQNIHMHPGQYMMRKQIPVLGQSGATQCVATTDKSAILLKVPGMRLIWQPDGDLTLRRDDNDTRWHSNTSGEGKHLCFDDEGELNIYDAAWGKIWDAGAKGAAKIVLLGNCELVAYDEFDRTTWSEKTSCN